MELQAIDLFCGAGGLTRGLLDAGMRVVCGVDVDYDCEYPYEVNNDVPYLSFDVRLLSHETLLEYYAPEAVKVLVGCAPCQPFSTYSHGRRRSHSDDWRLLKEFGRLVRMVKPEYVSMENVPQLMKHDIFREFIQLLEDTGYKVAKGVLNTADFGIPQSRNRLVVLASRSGPPIQLPASNMRRRATVRSAIGKLPAIPAGGQDPKDPLHKAPGLSEKNIRRIRSSQPGGTWLDWDKELRTDCHTKDSGSTYGSVYGRMKWDEPSPTLTTQFYNYGGGRFGHPEQDRALSFREGAILQSFPKDYKFLKPDRPFNTKSIGRMIGNAVPVKLGEAIGREILSHYHQSGKYERIHRSKDTYT